MTRLVAIAVLVIGLTALKLPLWPGRSAVPILALMGVANGVALLAIYTAGHFEDAQNAAVGSSTFGLLTIVLAWVFLKERLNILQWLGCTVACAGIGYLAL